MDLTLYNTRTRRLEAFAPLSSDRVTMYLCGPTVYNYVHIGNARGPVVFDVLAALLRRRFARLTYARNITDVDDKINKAAQDLGVPITTITDKYTQIYRDDMARLGGGAGREGQGGEGQGEPERGDVARHGVPPSGS